MLETKIRESIKKFEELAREKHIKQFRINDNKPYVLPTLAVDLKTEDGEIIYNTGILIEEISRIPGCYKEYKELIEKGFINY